MYKLITKLKDNPDFPIQVLRRYSDFEWLMRTLQIEEPTSIITPIPEKKIGGVQSLKKEDDPELLNRRKGL